MSALHKSVKIATQVIDITRQDIEQQLGSLILATDINRQNEFLTRLKAHLHNKDLRLEDVHDRHFMLQVNNNNNKKTSLSLL